MDIIQGNMVSLFQSYLQSLNITLPWHKDFISLSGDVKEFKEGSGYLFDVNYTIIIIIIKNWIIV